MSEFSQWLRRFDEIQREVNEMWNRSVFGSTSQNFVMFPPSSQSSMRLPSRILQIPINSSSERKGDELEDEMTREAIRRSIEHEENKQMHSTMESSPLNPNEEQQILEMSRIEAEHNENEQLQKALKQSILDVERKRQEEERQIRQAIEESERLERQRIREEQERQYLESLERDMAKQKQKEMEMQRQREEAEKRRREEEQRELEAALKLSLQLSSQRQRLQQLEEKLSKIPPEPSPTLSDTVQLVVRLPNGQRLTRSFLTSTTFAQVKDWIDTRIVAPETSEEIKKSIPEHYVFVQDFPRKVFSDLNQTLQDAGLVKRALISISEIDSVT